MPFNYSIIHSITNERLVKYAGMAYSTQQGVQHTYLAARDIVKRNVEGAMVECGVANGAQVCAMAEACRGEDREFHLFDSFCGIPMAGVNDHDQPGISNGKFLVEQTLPLKDRLVSSGVSVCSIENVKQNLSKHGFGLRYHYHEGWFQDTLPKTDTGPIAMLRLDGDLYESTKVCLEHLFSKIVLGGCLLVDDYPLPGCRKALDEFFAERGVNLEPVIACDTGAAYFRL